MKNYPYSSSTLSVSSPLSTATAMIDSPALLPQQRKKSARSIRFSPFVSVKKTTSHHSMTQKEKCNYWLQEDEFLMINQRNRFITKQIKQERRDHHIDGSYKLGLLCLRGLELRNKSVRQDAFEEVFIEQETQYLHDYVDDEAIAYAYISVTYVCQYRAERIALQDRKDIEDYIKI
ncbi:hypothetical protein FRACYDRAFT_246363 [Fragilariopsis cylindrus CCMP1102]|uniref:Uncharacterized protein n=1 Tax=Fragilariopsis cylindrus CCMP1102 TaxID=635003 RepID=A0A1E7EYZ9_9STRA|nr:hypothetical protein FRACYDRAFT_246363 [Fragilariopsis cylindrus CCMP1102]|eukprot:OEU11250.1 hypothetical protein FRACYDRAFT_246363 [Fragilariopsis cylindrus CCMP1102]